LETLCKGRSEKKSLLKRRESERGVGHGKFQGLPTNVQVAGEMQKVHGKEAMEKAAENSI
jgi:hypothetical protein